VVFRAAFGDEGFRTHRREVAARGLGADDAANPADGGVLHLDAGVIALVGEGGGDLAVVDLVVAIVGEAAAEADALDPRERVLDLAAHVHALADQIDGRDMVMIVVVIMIVVMIVLAVVVAAAVQAGAVGVAGLVLVAMAGQAVFAALLGIGGAQIAA